MNKIALVSTYPPFKCAIGIYEQHLAEALGAATGHELTVISEGGVGDLERIFVVDAYSRSGDFRAAILRQIDELSPSLVHFQHAPDLFPNNNRFLGLLADLSGRGIRSFVTLHTVYEDHKWRAFYALACRHASFIVHNQLCREALRDIVDDERRIHVIPHGTEMLELPDATSARHRLGLPADGFVFLFFGAIHVMKNLHTAVRAFRRVARGSTDAHLVVAGRPWRDRPYNKLYVAACKLASLRTSGLHWHDHYIEDALVDSYFAAADVVLLPYWQKYHSASGVFHVALGSGKPVLCSESPKFAEVGPKFSNRFPVFIPTHSATLWAQAMIRLMTDDELRRELGAALREFGEASTWSKVAAQHLAAFEH
jgi:glycosyltransferase involved in cell wall biosynthesis